MASTEQDVVVVLEHCRVSPPPGAVAGKSLPLTFFDLPLALFHPMPILLFYELPQSKAYFTQTVVPNLKHSLSLALKHFFLLAGNLILFPSSTTIKPEIRYIDGDSVSLIFAESTKDFNYLTGSNPRNLADFDSLAPLLPPCTYVTDSIVAPLLALQVTIFPNYGICFGFNRDHVVGDISAIVGFIKAWALITNLGSEEPLLASGLLPFYDRKTIKDPKGLYEIYTSQMMNLNESPQLQTRNTLLSLSDTVRATFIMSRADIKRLKEIVLAQRTNLTHVSSFVVVCAYVWSCLAKLRAVRSDEISEDELDYFICVADCRSRLDPPLPTTYFGNCIAPCIASTKIARLMGDEGFLIGAELIGDAISKRVNNEEGVLNGIETWISDRIKRKMPALMVSGSPKFSLDSIDFGWGKPKKFEASYNKTRLMTLNGCKASDGSLEVGLSVPEDKMDDLANIFSTGLETN